MGIDLINYKGKDYPLFQAQGFAAKYAFPFAYEVCHGVGYDIGCMKKEWAFPGSIPIDKNFNDGWDAYKLPHKNVDYIISSHCLEHLEDWVRALDYWTDMLKSGGVLFLYLPHHKQQYWLPWNNTKHRHILHQEDIVTYMENHNYINIFTGERDLNCSFTVIGEKQ